MLREYEFTFVTKTDIPEADRQKAVETYENILTREGGAVIKKDDWGSKRLAYPIKNNFKGHYFFYDVASNAANIAECERLLRIDENVLRHLVVKIKDDVDVQARQQELMKSDTTTQKQQV